MTRPIIDHRVPNISLHEATSEVAKRTLAAWLRAVQHYLPLAADQAAEDIEHVHHLRVWTRRAGAALELYADLLPKRRTAWMTRQLKRLWHAANEARDLDVLAQRLAKAPSGPEFGHAAWWPRQPFVKRCGVGWLFALSPTRRKSCHDSSSSLALVLSYCSSPSAEAAPLELPGSSPQRDCTP